MVYKRKPEIQPYPDDDPRGWPEIVCPVCGETERWKPGPRHTLKRISNCSHYTVSSRWGENWVEIRKVFKKVSDLPKWARKAMGLPE